MADDEADGMSPLNLDDDEADGMSLLSLISLIDSCPYDTSFFDSLYKLYLPNDDRPHGFIVPEVVDKMPWTSNFKITHGNEKKVELLDSSAGQDTSAACNKEFEKLVAVCQRIDFFNLNSEEYYGEVAIVGVSYPVHLFQCVAPLFGVVSQRAHLTAYTRTSSGLKIWVPRRSPAMIAFPNKLDSTVAGGVFVEDTPLKTIIREADQEASLPEDLTRRNVRPVGVLTYITVLEEGQGEVAGLVKPDMVHVYDMELAEDFTPKPLDEEVKEFHLLTPSEVMDALLRNEFKTDSAAVMLDFFMRHGIISDDTERHYTEISMRLHRTLPFATASPRL